MTFETKQKNYFLREMNRALPTSVMMNNDAKVLDLALGNVDPVMPGSARQGSIDINNIASNFGKNTSVLSRDATCRAIPMPGNAMRAPDARTGCGWWFSPSLSASSVGAYGSRRGPMSPNLDKQVGPGEWVWDPAKAYKLESMKGADRIKTCSDLQYRVDPKISWCVSTNRALVTNKNGFPAFPQAKGGDCPDLSIISEAKNCPVPTSEPGSAPRTVGVSDICTPNNGVLGPACLQNVVSQAGCNSGGVLAKTLGSGYAGTSAAFNQTNKLITQRGFTLHSGIVNDGRVSVQDALSSVRGLKTFANSGDGSRATSAALSLCYGTPFDPCQYNAGDNGPFDPVCITQTALNMGYSPEGGLLPSKIGQAYWDQFRTWQDAVNALRWWKNVADLGPAFAGQNITPQLQTGGIANVYGLSVKYPKQGCNNFGVLMYRYFFPTWDGNLFPAKGPMTHFLGRYILKEGFPYYPGSTYQDQTPAGGYLTEGQRMVTNFYPNEGGTYQFLISCDDYVRLQVNDNIIAQVGCCGVPTASQTVQMQPGQVYKMVIDLWNGGGPWSFSIKMSVNGKGWQDIPLKQMYMTQDRRLPTIELAFNKMAAGTSGAIKDTNNVFQNLALSANARIGNLNGRNCLIVNGTDSCVHNHASVSQGIRVRAMKSITMMVQVSSVNYPSGTTPSVVSFFNLPNSNVTAPPQKYVTVNAPECKGLGRPGVLNNTNVRVYNNNECNIIGGNFYSDGQCLRKGGGSYSWDCRVLNNNTQPVSYFDRKNDFMFTISKNAIYPYGINPAIYTHANGQQMPYPAGQWFHVAFVWDEDFTGYVMYVNGVAGPRQTCPSYDVKLMMEQIRIGCDVHPDGQSWTGGIAWFRTFDYRLSADLVKRDMNDDWASLE